MKKIFADEDDKNVIDRQIVAYNQIKKLFALGIKDKEIGVLVNKAKWDKTQVFYDTLEDRIQELQKKK